MSGPMSDALLLSIEIEAERMGCSSSESDEAVHDLASDALAACVEIRRLRGEVAQLLAEADANQFVLTQTAREREQDREAMRASVASCAHSCYLPGKACGNCEPILERLETKP